MAPFGESLSRYPDHPQPLGPYRREDYRPHEYDQLPPTEPISQTRHDAWAENSSAELQPLPVVDLHPSNFNRVVLDPARTVVVAFYAPWCKAVEVESLLVDLQHDLAGEFDIVLGRVDADMYKDIFAHFNGTTLPAIFIFPMAKKRGMEYTGPRNKQALIEYIILHHRGEVVTVPRRRRQGPKRSDFRGSPAPVDAPPRKEDYPHHPYEFYIPPPPPMAPEAESLIHRPPGAYMPLYPPQMPHPYEGNWGPPTNMQPYPSPAYDPRMYPPGPLDPRMYPAVENEPRMYPQAAGSSHSRSYTRPFEAASPFPSSSLQPYPAAPAPAYAPMLSPTMDPYQSMYPHQMAPPYSEAGHLYPGGLPLPQASDPYAAHAPPPYFPSPAPMMQPQHPIFPTGMEQGPSLTRMPTPGYPPAGLGTFPGPY